MNLFTLEDEKPVLSPEARLIPVFNTIIRRDKNRNKEVAMKEIAYIYYMCDYKSPVLSNTSQSEHHKKACVYVGFDYTDWEPDEEIKEAMQFYKEERVPQSQKLLFSVVQTLESTNDTLKAFRDSISNFSREYQTKAIVSSSKDTDSMTSDELEKHIKEQEFLDKRLDGTLSRVEKMLKIVKEIPPNVKQIRELITKVQKEIEDENTKRRGGKDPNPAQDPDFFAGA